jgi:hypothetical protein
VPLAHDAAGIGLLGLFLGQYRRARLAGQEFRQSLNPKLDLILILFQVRTGFEMQGRSALLKLANKLRRDGLAIRFDLA